MYNKVLTGILIVLLIAIIGTLGFLGYSYFTKYNKEKDAEKFLAQEFDTMIVDLNQNEPDEINKDKQEQSENNQNQNTNKNTNQNKTSQNSNNVGYYKGFKVAGKIELPTLRKQFPVLDAPEASKAIEVSVNKVYGPELNMPGNTVIAGHNYNNGTFFSNNKKLNVGDKIYITDLKGNRVQYTIFNKYYTPETDNSFFTRQTNGKAEVTLYTCDATGANRLIICARAD